MDTLPPLDRCMGGWMGGWVGQWVGSCQIIKNQVNRHLIEIIEFCLKIYDLSHTLTFIDVWVGGWVGQWIGSCQINKNQVNCHLIKITEFCLKIYDLWRHTQLWVCVWVDGWVGYCLGQWVGPCQITTNSIIWKLIKIIQFC